MLLQGELLTQIFEIAPNKFAVGSWGQPWTAVIDKQAGSVNKIHCLHQNQNQTTDLAPLIGFDVRHFPFLVLRTKESLNLVNLRTGKMNLLLQRPNNAGSFEKLVII